MSQDPPPRFPVEPTTAGPQPTPPAPDIRRAHTDSPLQRFLANLGRSRFFTISLLLHAGIVLMLGSTVLFQAVLEEQDFFGEPGSGFLSPSTQVQAPPVQTQQQPVTTPQLQPTAPTLATPSTRVDAITTTALNVSSFAVPAFSAVVPPKAQAPAAAPPPTTNAFSALDKQAAARISEFSKGWTTGPRSTGTGGLRRRRFEFTAYLAKYSGGDWNSTVTLDREKKRIVGGSLPNLLFFMKKFSSDRIDANPNAVPLDLASDEIFTVRPPFIFFTGRRDFTLSDAEVDNLRKYVMNGGAIWGDSTLPGRRSRFDIAFRREMRRVLPDVDKDFEPLADDHEIFTMGYFNGIRSVPPGLNFYQEPVEVLRIYGEIAVIYTLNDYGDMWQVGIDENGAIDMRRDANRQYVALNQNIWSNREVYFRNLSEESLMAAYQFGTNIVTHLLIRWENPLRRAGAGGL